ncbi:trypsin-like peptidase domain-containing protein [Fodinibius halophilus]|uniref:PDZ domain-containing protein n=1 Tax=Fodinibius halophilus TaxID=1736908 RepID=A0A6M1T2Z1_9BACT|nr:trypsin-like peptidase domain-containing protein [Fodinibius halophilus]NGP89836.1 PDZ domain-containing protein [Fodinibius halophilus]
MKSRDRYLSGILLVLIGVIIGTLIAFYQQQNMVDDHAEVEVTEVKHNSTPIFSDEELTKIDDRFLFKQIAERVTPTVVYIETVIPFSGRRNVPDDEFHDEEDGFWGNIIPRRTRTVGSGIIISSDGYILTNNHVIDGAVEDGIEVVLNDKRAFEARIVGQDPTTDLAVLKVPAKNLPAITIGNSNEVDVGEWVLAIGNPFRLRSTVTAGIVSALSRDVQIINDQMRVESFIQTDAAINKGNSGGALVNTDGELIGVNTAIASQSGSYQGYGFSVPSNLAAKVGQDLIQYGEVRRALLGVTIVSVNAELAEQLNMAEIRGVQITAVSPSGAAAKAGLQTEDVILSVDGDKVNESNQLQQKIAVRNPGELVKLNILRNGRELQKTVELGLLEPEGQQFANTAPPEETGEKGGDSDHSLDDESRFAVLDFGIKVMAIRKEGTSDTFHLIITEVVNGSEAAEKELKAGFEIIKVGDQKVEDLESLKDLISQFLNKYNSVLLEVKTREGEAKVVELEQ